MHMSMHGCDISFQDSPDASSKPILRDCNLQASPGSLLVVSGAVGCGKTTLIRCIIGAVKPASGELSLTGGSGSGSESGTLRIAYAPQKPFLISGTIRENILFGLPLDGPFYEEVLPAVSLKLDLARLPDGDATRLEGAEATLSGGQRARIALARVVYARREVVVLDDPLAAVDAKVRAHLVERVLGPRGILRDTLRIVTTSSDSLMAQVDVLYVVRDGTLCEAARPQLVHQKAVDVSQDTSSQSEHPHAVATRRSGYGSITGPAPTALIQAATSNTSLGQILNRFTNDINKIDSSVSGGLISLVALFVTATASILVIIAATPLSIMYLPPIGSVYFAIQAHYQNACRQLRRLEMLARGPILNTASEMRVGAVVIQTFNQQDNFRRQARHVINDHIRVWLPFVALIRGCF
jgi:ABC-type multidrug transport system fused ATPase/permease subunit